MIKALWLIGFITLVLSGTVFADINLDNANTAEKNATQDAKIAANAATAAADAVTNASSAAALAISKAAEASGHAHDQTSSAYDTAKAASADAVKKAQDAAAAAQKALLAATKASEAAENEAKAALTAQSQVLQTVIYFQNRLVTINSQVEKAQKAVDDDNSKLTAAKTEYDAKAKLAADAKTAVNNLNTAISAARRNGERPATIAALQEQLRIAKNKEKNANDDVRIAKKNVQAATDDLKFKEASLRDNIKNQNEFKQAVDSAQKTFEEVKSIAEKASASAQSAVESATITLIYNNQAGGYASQANAAFSSIPPWSPITPP